MRPYSIAATRPHEASPLKHATCASAFSWHRRIQTGCPELTGATEPQIIDLWRDVDQISRANPSSRLVFPPIHSFLHCPVHGAPPLNTHLQCSGPALLNFILVLSPNTIRNLRFLSHSCPPPHPTVEPPPSPSRPAPETRQQPSIPRQLTNKTSPPFPLTYPTALTLSLF